MDSFGKNIYERWPIFCLREQRFLEWLMVVSMSESHWEKQEMVVV